MRFDTLAFAVCLAAGAQPGSMPPPSRRAGLRTSCSTVRGWEGSTGFCLPPSGTTELVRVDLSLIESGPNSSGWR